MATKTRYTSPSPAPSFPTNSTGVVTTVSLNHLPPPSLAAPPSHQGFPAPQCREPHQLRRSELTVLKHHSPRSAVLHLDGPSVGGRVLGESPAGPLPSVSEICKVTSAHAGRADRLPYAWATPLYNADNSHSSSMTKTTTAAATSLSTSSCASKFNHLGPEKPRSLSIQSLISSPDSDRTAFDSHGGGNYTKSSERGMKRKGSDDRDEDVAQASRSSRGGSVVSGAGLSMEDPDVRDAVEALGGLKADFANPPTAPHSPQQQTLPQQEPLLNLLQSSPSVHPLLSTALSFSTSTYAASKSYIAPFRYVAESAENLTVPVVSAVGRRTGIEDYIRRELTRHNRGEPTNRSEKKRRKGDAPPAADGTKVSQLVESSPTTRERGWQTRLYYSSTGLATALSDESRRSLKYCLKILFTANANLVTLIETLSSVVDELDRYLHQKTATVNSEPFTPCIVGHLPESLDQRRQRLAQTVDRLKDEALKTLKTVVDTISRYAGGGLPEQAREVVKRQLLAFPMRWQAAASSTTSTAVQQPSANKSDCGDEKDAVVSAARDDDSSHTKGKAVRVLVMAREGLDMMRSVTEVVEGTLASADEWCDRFGKSRGEDSMKAEEREKEKKEQARAKEVAMVGWKNRDGEVDVMIRVG